MPTPRHRRSATSSRNRPAVAVAVSALVIAVGLAVVADRPSQAIDATSRPDDALTAVQSVQRGTDRADRSTDRQARPSTSTTASTGAHAKPALPAIPNLPKPTPTPTRKPAPKPAAPAEVVPKKRAPVPAVVGYRFATTALKVRATASAKATTRGVVPRSTRIGVTGRVSTTFAQVVVDGKSAWVTKAYLATSRPTAPTAPSKSAPAESKTSDGFSTAPCATGSSMESGLTRNAVNLHRAACSAFPAVRRFGGLGPTGEHAAGRAVDIMVSGDSLGDAISTWARTNAGALHISEVIWSQRIWTVQRSSEGWRPMSDRGSRTANHYDHVHVTLY